MDAELHVHLEGTVDLLLARQLAAKHRVELPHETWQLLGTPFAGCDFSAFVERWKLVGSLLRDADDFAQVVVAYAARLAEQGATYAEAIFSPAEPARLGVPWDAVFSGYCDGADRAGDLLGVEIRFTPDITRSFSLEEAELVVDWAIRFGDRGVVGLGLGGFEAVYPAALFERPFARAKDAGLVSVPHAGEMAGPESVRACLDILGADRIRHGVRVIEDPDLMAELVERQIVLDVCPTANVLLGVVPSLDLHPLPLLVERGVLCTVSTDNPAIFGTTLADEHAIAHGLGVRADRLRAATAAGRVVPA